MKKQVIITGGGSGSRMKTDIPKQFLEIDGIPILFYSMAAFALYEQDISIILTLPEKSIPYWKKLVVKHNFNIEHQVIKGGDTRFQSVKNGLSLVSEQTIVAIHDAVRPFVSAEVIAKSFSQAETLGGVIPIVPVVDSMRKINVLENQILNRNEIFAVQTPQVFQSNSLKSAYLVAENSLFTDDASVYEHSFNAVSTIEGNRENIKITSPMDLVIAESFVKLLSNDPSFPQIGFFKR